MTQAHSKKIVILGCSTKAGAYVSKQFNKAGFDVIIYDWTNLPNKKSRYVKEYIQSHSPEANLISFEEKFLKFLSENSIYALLPLHDAALEIVRHIKSEIPSNIKVLGLNADAIYKYAHNKWELLKLAKDNGLQVPATEYVSSVDELKKSYPFTFPCIVKPVSSALIKDKRLYTFSVSVVRNQQELEDKVREVILNVPVMIQEFVDGYGIGFNFLAKDGTLLSSYIHKRISEHGGVSSYREMLSASTYGNKDALADFVKKINWTGVGMLEFKVKDGVPYLMELNGRFFGSIELSVKSGLNLPKQFLDLYLENKLPAAGEDFHLHTKVRNLHDEVLLNFAGLAKGKLGAFLKWGGQVVKSIFSRHDFIEDNFFDDPRFVTALYTKDIQRVIKKFKKKSSFKSLEIKPLLWKNSDEALTVAFICKGNICRSPFAEVYARSVTSSQNFFSFGSYPQENRLSPLNALAAAEHLNISLENHTSHFLHQDTIPRIDIFVVMDKINYFDLIAMNIPSEKIRFLHEEEIADPYKKNYEYFVSTYTTIKNSIDLILKNEKNS